MPRFQVSELTQRIVNCLRLHDKNTLLTYVELSSMIGVDITPSNGKLSHARTILQRDHAQVWICIRPRAGIKRLNDAEIAERLPGWFLNGARRKLHRGGKQADVVELGQLNIDQQSRFAVDSIQRQLASEALSRSTRRRMERAARGTSNDLPSFTAVEWAISLSPRRANR